MGADGKKRRRDSNLRKELREGRKFSLRRWDWDWDWDEGVDNGQICGKRELFTAIQDFNSLIARVSFLRSIVNMLVLWKIGFVF